VSDVDPTDPTSGVPPPQQPQSTMPRVDPPDNGRSRASRFMRARGANPAFILGVAGVVVLAIIVAISWTLYLSHRPPAPAQDANGNILGGSAVAAAPGVNGDGAVPFTIPSGPPTATPSPAASGSPMFPFGNSQPSATPTPLPTPTPYPTPTPVPSYRPVYVPPSNNAPNVPTNPNQYLPVAQRPSTTLAFGSARPSNDDDVPAIDPASGGSNAQTSDASGNGAVYANGNQQSGASSNFAPNGGTGSTGAIATRVDTLDSQHQAQFVSDQESRGIGYVRNRGACTVALGSYITLRLKSKIDSSLPGPFTAVTKWPLYDKVDHNRECVPSGTLVYSIYDSQVISGQNRLLASGATFVFSNGDEYMLGGLPATDAQGASGITGDTDKHIGATIAPAFILTTVAAAEAFVSPQTSTSLIYNPSPAQAAQQAGGSQLSSIGGRIVQQNVARPPTIIVRPPDEIQMVVTHDLPLVPYDPSQGASYAPTATGTRSP
jgi:type IV secretory pathway VirB10-like protein